jgi:hypothetical protein
LVTLLALGWVGLVGTVAAVVAAVVCVITLAITLHDRRRPVRVKVIAKESEAGGDTRLFWEASMGNGRTVVLHRFGVLVEDEPEPLYLTLDPTLGCGLPAPLAANDKLLVGTYFAQLRKQLVMSNHGARDVSMVAFFEDGGGTKYQGTGIVANATTRYLYVDGDLPVALEACRRAAP